MRMVTGPVRPSAVESTVPSNARTSSATCSLGVGETDTIPWLVAEPRTCIVRDRCMKRPLGTSTVSETGTVSVTSLTSVATMRSISESLKTI